jgi:hypothetical protein
MRLRRERAKKDRKTPRTVLARLLKRILLLVPMREEELFSHSI